MIRIILEILDDQLWQPAVFLWKKTGQYLVVPLQAALNAVFWSCKAIVLLTFAAIMFCIYTVVLFAIFSYVCDRLTYSNLDAAILLTSMAFACVAAWKAFLNATNPQGPLYRNVVDPASKLKTKLLSPNRAKVHQQRTKK